MESVIYTTGIVPSEKDIEFAKRLYRDCPGWFGHVAAHPLHRDHGLISWAKENLPEIVNAPPQPKHVDANTTIGRKRKMEQ